MKKIIATFMLFLSSCTLNTGPADVQTGYCKIAYGMMNDFSKSVKKNDCLYLDMIGGSMMEDIVEIKLSFVTEKYLNIDQTRKLIVHTSQKLIAFFDT